MRIAVDLHGIQSDGSRSRGIGRYSLEIIKNIITQFKEHHIFLVANAALSDLQQEFKDYLYYDNVSFIKWYSPSPFDFISGNNKRTKLACYLKSYTYSCLNADIILITSFFEGYSDNCLVDFDLDFVKAPIVSIFYDLIPFIQPDSYLRNNPGFKKFYMSRIKKIKELDGLLAISKSSAQEALKYLGMDPSKVYNISSGCDKKVFNNSSKIGQSSIIQINNLDSFILYSGAIDPRKNVKRLLNAFSQLPVELDKYKLVLVGKLLDVEEELLDQWIDYFNIDSTKIIRTGYVSDSDLVILYRKCSLFIFPSLHEGFGLPVLEAMCCEAPVIGSNCTSIPEVICLEKAMFDPENIDDIKNLIIKSITNEEFKNELKLNSLEQSQRFSWEITTKSLINACQSVIDKKKLISVPLKWNLLNQEKKIYLNLLIKKINYTRFSKINNEEDLYSQVAAAIDKITFQLDKIIRELSSAYNFCSWRIEGPFDSSYSLSILNRSFADALKGKVDQCSLHITEGLGDYSPDIEYLKRFPKSYSLYKSSLDSSSSPDILSRNLYPPRVNDMKAKLNILHSYGWEESEFPSEWVSDFNSYLQGITVMSSQVKKILIDNGVDLPIKVAGLGLDHFKNIQPSLEYQIKAKKFKILHISSCFPRKGIDVLLKAYGDAFTYKDDVTLIIKTFDNPHNNLDSFLTELQDSNPLFPDVLLINKDLSENEIKSLYLQSNLLIAPSRGEGFGLPIAEAMLLGLPVITTNWGGQLDFCNNKNSWLIDYEFVASQSHFNLDNSYWAEPLVEDLKERLIHIYKASAEEIAVKTNNAKELINSFTWEKVVDETILFIKNELPLSTKKISRIGWVTTWNERCGIASYSRNLIDCMTDEVIIFSPSNNHIKEITDKNVIPCWDVAFDKDQDLNQLFLEICSKNITSLVIQFNYGFFNFYDFSKLIDKLVSNKINVLVFLHSTIDPSNNEDKKLKILAKCFKKCARILVHTISDMNRLKNLGLVENVSLFPHGIIDKPLSLNSKIPPRQSKKITNKLNIASFGFCLPNKGFSELIHAIKLLKNSKYNVSLNLYSSIYNESYAYYYDELIDLVKHLDIDNLVYINKDYLTPHDIQNYLCQNDLIVYPYQPSTTESSSAAVRDGIASLKPILVTPLPVFDDVSDLVDYLPGVSPSEISNGILEWIENVIANPINFKKNYSHRQKQINNRRFSYLAIRLSALVHSLEINYL